MTQARTPIQFVVFRVAALAVLLGACSAAETTSVPPPPSGPTGGWLTLQLSTPRADDGAIQVAVNGPRIDSVKIIGYDGFQANSGTQVDLVATGSITNGNLARVYVPDLSRTTEYRVVVTAAAARDTYQLQPLDGYRAVLVR